MMKSQMKRRLGTAAVLLTVFILWTVAVATWDVRPIGPHGSAVGFATLNDAFHRLTGVHMWLYTVTDWLGLVPITVVFGFAVLGFAQWIRRRQFRRVDYSLLVLGGFFLLVFATYLLFETVVINYRPVLINGVLEVSYPSSTTLLVSSVMPAAAMQCSRRMRHTACRRAVVWVFGVFVAFMVIGRLISGVHWLSDIIGGGLLSGSLVMLYRALCDKER